MLSRLEDALCARDLIIDLPVIDLNASVGDAVRLLAKERARPIRKPPVHEQYLAGPGALLMRMARNRNLGWIATAKTFLVLTGGYWSPATYGGVGHGRTQLTPELLADFCAVLDVPVEELAALTGVAQPGAASVQEPDATR